MANANIFAQYVKPVRSMQDYANDYDVAEQNQLALAAKRMDMQKAQRGEADAQTMRGIAQQYGGDENALIRAYRQGGFLDQAAGLEKSIADRLKAKADAGKTDADTRKSDAETQAKGFDLAKNRYNQYRMALGALAGDPALAKEKVIGVAGGLVDAGILTPELAQKLTAALPDDPEALRAYIISGRDAQLSPEQQSKLFAPEFSWQDSGQQKIPVQVNPRAPGYTAPQTIQRVATPGEVLTDTRTREEGAKNRGVQYAGQKIQRDRLEFDKGTAIADAGGPNQAALVKQLGKPPKDHRWKVDGSAEPIPGGPADLKSGEQGAKAAAKRESQVAQAESVLSTIADAKKLVGYNTAGVGGLLAKVPMTDARNLQAKLDTVKANLGFDRLQQMRDQSPTGGALGAVAVQELVALQSTVASLDQLQSPSEIGRALQKIEGHYKRWVDVMKQGQGGQGGASGNWSDKPAAGGGVVDFGSLK